MVEGGATVMVLDTDAGSSRLILGSSRLTFVIYSCIYLLLYYTIHIAGYTTRHSISV